MADTAEKHPEAVEHRKERIPDVPRARPRELQVRIACAKRSALEVLAEVRRGLVDAEATGQDLLLVFEDLGRLEDSIVTLIKGLCRLLIGHPGTVTFWESSGYAEAFLSVIETVKEG